MSQIFEQLIYNVIDHHPEFTLAKNLESVLLGNTSGLDSIALVSFLIDVETEVNTHFDSSIAIMDEKAFSLKESPFLTVRSLIKYLKKQLEHPHADR